MTTRASVHLRPYAGEVDIPHMVDIANAAMTVDAVSEHLTAEQVRLDLRPDHRSDPAVDLFVAEVDGGMVGFVKVEWIDTNDGFREYRSWGEVHPTWRRRGVGTVLFDRAQDRIRQVAAGHDTPLPRMAGCWRADSDVGADVLYRGAGFEPARWFFHMTRDLSQPIADISMPAGLEVRPTTREDARRLFDADIEAFRDHWGGVDGSDEQFEKWISESTFDPSLHVIAFDGDEIAGASVNTIYSEANAKLGIERGWLDSVFTRRPWRRRGLARALVARSLVVLRDRGMAEAILGVDAGNETGALGVYTDNGFGVIEKFTAYRKPFEVDR